jgi:hypothetical protein
MKDHASREGASYVIALPGETADDAASASQGILPLKRAPPYDKL